MFYLVRRKSSTRKPLRWPTRTAGSSTWKPLCPKKLSTTTSLTFNSSQRLSQTSVLISISSRLWPSSLLKYWRKPSTLLSWWNLKRRSTGCSELMPSISPSASFTRTVLKDNSLRLRTFRPCRFNRGLKPWNPVQLWAQCCPRRSQQNSSSAQKCLRMPSVWSSNATSLRFAHSIRRWIPAAHWIADPLWSVSSSPVWRTRSRCLRKNPRKKRQCAPPLPFTSSAESLKRWSRPKPAREMPLTGTSDNSKLLISSCFTLKIFLLINLCNYISIRIINKERIKWFHEDLPCQKKLYLAHLHRNNKLKALRISLSSCRTSNRSRNQ